MRRSTRRSTTAPVRPSTGVTPTGIPGVEEGLCDYCAYDPEAAQAAFDEWKAAGNSLDRADPDPVQRRRRPRERRRRSSIDNLAAIGIQAEAEPFPTETYFTELADGACQLCRSGWYADYPTYDNFMYDLFHSDAIGGNNHGFVQRTPSSTPWSTRPRQTVDPDAQGELFRQAESILLNDDIGVIPINWYRGDYAYNDEKVTNFPQNQLRSDPLGDRSRSRAEPSTVRGGGGRCGALPDRRAMPELRMTSYIIRRVLLIIPTVFFALSFLFFLFFLLPGRPGARCSPAAATARSTRASSSGSRSATASTTRCLEQFVDYWKRTLRWDLGDSYQNNRSVNEILGETRGRAACGSAFWAILDRDHRRDLGRDPLRDPKIFVAGPADDDPHGGRIRDPRVRARLLPAVHVRGVPEQAGLARVDAVEDAGIGPDTWALFVIPTGDQWRYLVLPAVTLACVSTALAARMTRGSMLEVLGADYMRTARAKGLTERDVVTRHGLRNAMLPVVTLIGIDFGTVIGVAVLTETVFSWPGLGSEIADAVTRRDCASSPRTDARRRARVRDHQPARRPVVRLVRSTRPARIEDV